MNGNASTGTLSHLAPIVHGATKVATNPGTLRRQLCGRALARSCQRRGWTAEDMLRIAAHLELTAADIRVGVAWTQADLAVVRRKLGITQKLSDPDGMVTT